MSKQGTTSQKTITGNTYDPKKFTHVRKGLTKDSTPEEDAQAIKEMADAMVDALFGKDFGREGK